MKDHSARLWTIEPTVRRRAVVGEREAMFNLFRRRDQGRQESHQPPRPRNEQGQSCAPDPVRELPDVDRRDADSNGKN